jgi:hypothetical protein
MLRNLSVYIRYDTPLSSLEQSRCLGFLSTNTGLSTSNLHPAQIIHASSPKYSPIASIFKVNPLLRIIIEPIVSQLLLAGTAPLPIRSTTIREVVRKARINIIDLSLRVRLRSNRPTIFSNARVDFGTKCAFVIGRGVLGATAIRLHDEGVAWLALHFEVLGYEFILGALANLDVVVPYSAPNLGPGPSKMQLSIRTCAITQAVVNEVRRVGKRMLKNIMVTNDLEKMEGMFEMV